MNTDLRLAFAITRFRVRYSWWLPVYLHTLMFFCVLCNRMPDEDKLLRWIWRGLIAEISVLGGDWQRVPIGSILPR